MKPRGAATVDLRLPGASAGGRHFPSGAAAARTCCYLFLTLVLSSISRDSSYLRGHPPREKLGLDTGMRPRGGSTADTANDRSLFPFCLCCCLTIQREVGSRPGIASGETVSRGPAVSAYSVAAQSCNSEG